MTKARHRKINPALPQVEDESGNITVLEPKAAPEAAPEPGPLNEPGLFRVVLNCPTPLEFKILEVDAENEHDAKRQFDAANGISGSDHPYTITRI